MNNDRIKALRKLVKKCSINPEGPDVYVKPMKYSKEFIRSLWDVYIAHNPKGTLEKFKDRLLILIKAQELYSENRNWGSSFDLLKKPKVIKKKL